MGDMVGNITPILTASKKQLGKQAVDKLKLAWYFESFLDKLILVILATLGLWKFVEIVGGFFLW